MLELPFERLNGWVARVWEVHNVNLARSNLKKSFQILHQNLRTDGHVALCCLSSSKQIAYSYFLN